MLEASRALAPLCLPLSASSHQAGLVGVPRDLSRSARAKERLPFFACPLTSGPCPPAPSSPLSASSQKTGLVGFSRQSAATWFTGTRTGDMDRRRHFCILAFAFCILHFHFPFERLFAAPRETKGSELFSCDSGFARTTAWTDDEVKIEPFRQSLLPGRAAVGQPCGRRTADGRQRGVRDRAVDHCRPFAPPSRGIG